LKNPYYTRFFVAGKHLPFFWKNGGRAGANLIDPDLTPGYEVPDLPFSFGRSSAEGLQTFEKPQALKIFRSR